MASNLFINEKEVKRTLERKIKQEDYKTIIQYEFGNIFSCMHKTSYIFGGAIRDLVAYGTIHGDLDIAIKKKHYKKTQEDILQNMQGYKIKQRKQIRDEYGHIMQVHSREIYKKGKKKIDLIFWKGMRPQNIAKEVDFMCCGLVMDYKGEIKEILPGAYRDCEDKILRLNEQATYANLKQRLDKLSQRGWTFKI